MTDFVLTEEDRLDREINKQQTILLKEIPQNIDILDLIKDNYRILSDFEDVKLTYVLRSKKLEYPVVIKMRQNLYNEYTTIFNEVINEAFVGLYGTNRLNSENFARIVAANPSNMCLESFYWPGRVPYSLEERQAIRAGEIDCAYTVYEYIWKIFERFSYDKPSFTRYQGYILADISSSI